MENQWEHPDLASDYDSMVTDVNKNWYEIDVNKHDMLAMIPKDARSVLDFGCGPGYFTNELAGRFNRVDGCDISQEMINRAQRQESSASYFVWDIANPFPSMATYDVVMSKLTLQFVDDLDLLARRLKEVLNPGGLFVFSIPHPFRTVDKRDDIAYWGQQTYQTEIGQTGLEVSMIHRNLEDTLGPFLDAGYKLVDMHEPEIPDELRSTRAMPPGYSDLPLRLNVRMQLD